MKSLLSLFLLFTLSSAFLIGCCVPFGVAQSGLITVINSDITWAIEESPYNLTGPTLVSTGATLTINPGVVVNLNGYELFINGTLRANGYTSNSIQINSGDITFGDSDQTGLDSSFENVVINSTISSSKPLRMNNNTIIAGISIGATSELTNNVILRSITAGSSTTLLNNNIEGDVSVGDSCIITNNTIGGDVITGGSARISNNTINGSRYYPKPPGGHGYTIALTVGSSSEILNNTISGGIKASSSKIMNNIISGGAPFTDWGGRGSDSTSAVTVDGTSSIISNTIFSSTGGYGVLIMSGHTHLSGNVIHNRVRVAGDALIESNLLVGTGIQVGHIFVSAFNEINYGYGDSIIRNNIFTGGGVSSAREGGTSTIMHNLISNHSVGIVVSSQMTILNNTIANNSVGIKLYSASATIEYNNIINCTQNSIQLSSVSLAVNATYNWWGTVDTQAINLTIRDYKYEFGLGKVDFVPFLSEPNSQATPNEDLEYPDFVIPEFSTWLILLYLIIGSFLLLLSKNKIQKGSNVCT